MTDYSSQMIDNRKGTKASRHIGTKLKTKTKAKEKRQFFPLWKRGLGGFISICDIVLMS